VPSPEIIVVREYDFKRYGSDLSKLRECQVPPWVDVPRPKVEEPEPPVSFAHHYARLCRRRHAENRDPWKDVPNPESFREVTLNDRIVNQVWVDLPRGADASEAKPGQALWAAAKTNLHIAPRSSLPARPGSSLSSPRLRSSCCSRGTSATRAGSCDLDPDDNLTSSGGSCEVALLDMQQECIGAENAVAIDSEKENVQENVPPTVPGGDPLPDNLNCTLQSSGPTASQPSAGLPSVSEERAKVCPAAAAVQETRTDSSWMPSGKSRPRSAFAYRSSQEDVGALTRPPNLRIAARAVLQERSHAKSKASQLQLLRPVMPADFLASTK